MKRTPKYGSSRYVYPDLQGEAEQRRAFILERLTEAGDAAQIDGRILVENMAAVERFLIDGSIPPPKTAPKRHIREVKV